MLEMSRNEKIFIAMIGQMTVRRTGLVFPDFKSNSIVSVMKKVKIGLSVMINYKIQLSPALYLHYCSMTLK